MLSRSFVDLLKDVNWSNPKIPIPVMETFSTPKSVEDFEKYLIRSVKKFVPNIENLSVKKVVGNLLFFGMIGKLVRYLNSRFIILMMK